MFSKIYHFLFDNIPPQPFLFLTNRPLSRINKISIKGPVFQKVRSKLNLVLVINIDLLLPLKQETHLKFHLTSIQRLFYTLPNRQTLIQWNSFL
jgi:hypothetical protein